MEQSKGLPEFLIRLLVMLLFVVLVFGSTASFVLGLVRFLDHHKYGVPLMFLGMCGFATMMALTGENKNGAE